MTTREALILGIKNLKKSKVGSPMLDADVLLAFTTKRSKEHLYANPEAKLTSAQDKLFQKLIARRAKYEPVAYITGHKDFFGLNFIVNRNVLIPRPETELMVEEILKIIRKDTSSPPLGKGRKIIIDVGTGSGCIPIAIVKNSGVSAIAIDASSVALKIARQNAKRHHVLDSRLRGNDKKEGGSNKRKIRFIKGNLLQPILKNYKLKSKSYQLIITANLPYLPTSEWRSAMPDVKRYEPRLALDGGRDGLKYYRELLPQIQRLKKPDQKLFCLFEFCPEQKQALKKLALGYFPAAKVEIKKDLAGRDRLMAFGI